MDAAAAATAAASQTAQAKRAAAAEELVQEVASKSKGGEEVQGSRVAGVPLVDKNDLGFGAGKVTERRRAGSRAGR